MSLKHAILGFLSFAPFSGYDLKKAFDRSVRHFWPANQSQIYRTLAELDEQGFVEKEVVAREERLDMKIYSITEKGRTELHKWLSTPLPEQEPREPFLIQIYFGSRISDDELLGLLRGELKVTEERLAVYEAVYQANKNTPGRVTDERAVFLSLLTLEAGYINNQSVAQWLRSAIQRIQAKNYSIDITEKA
jgi:PadR family transcriptional regulator, regulatory protein AphA